MTIILASSSPFRKAILENLSIPFQAIAANIDETPLHDEKPSDLVARLAEAKASAIPADKDDYIISSDQVATIDGQILGKPHTEQRAIEQLTRFSGRTVEFYTSLCLKQNDNVETIIDTFRVHFRNLSQNEIKAYIKKEQPLNCAGSFKSEGLGILLFSKLEGDDPNALIGLPIIALNQLFLNLGVNLLTDFN